VLSLPGVYRVQARISAEWETAKSFPTYQDADRYAEYLLGEGEVVSGVKVQRLMAGTWVDVYSIEPRGES